jgi:uncharacterized protein
MLSFIKILLSNEEVYLYPEKVMYLPANNILVISDVHLGKAGHFRKHGIALGMDSHIKDIQNIQKLIDVIQPQKIMFLGDLFHSKHNKEWTLVEQLIIQNNQIEYILVEGNHDVLSYNHYKNSGIQLMTKMEIGDLIFTHEPIENIEGKINICGHIHPGFTLYGKAKQSVTVPCFYKSHYRFIMPAFGSLTGLHVLNKIKNTEVYLIAGSRIIQAT